MKKNCIKSSYYNGDTTICSSSPVLFVLDSLITGEDSLGIWSRLQGSLGTFDSIAHTFLTPGFVTSNDTSKFLYIVKSAIPCPADTSIATIISIARANAGTDGSTTVCDNSTDTITLANLLGGEQSGGAWTRLTGTGGNFNAASGTFVPATVVTTSTFQYIVTGTTPCPNDTGIVTVNISPNPTISGITVNCNGASLNNVIVNASIGVGVLEYNVDGGIFQTSNTFTGLSMGSHTFIAREQTTLCSSSLSQIISCSCGTPVITCPSDFIGCIGTSTIPAVTGFATATSGTSCCPTPVVTFTDIDLGSTCSAGKHIQRRWVATDTSTGLADTCFQDIEINDTEAPIFLTCFNDTTVACLSEVTTPLNLNGLITALGGGETCLTPSTTVFNFGSTAGTFPFGTGINLVDATNIDSSFNYNIFNELTGTLGSGGQNDVKFDLNLITGYDVYGGLVLNPLKGTAATSGHHIRQSTSGLAGQMPHGNIVANRSSTGDVIGYSIYVDFADHVKINAEDFSIRYTSGNTAGECFESAAIVLYNENDQPYGSAEYTGFYQSPPLGVPCGDSTPIIDGTPWTTTGTGVYVAQDTSTMRVNDIFNPNGGINGSHDNKTVSATADAGLSNGMKIGGFLFTILLEDAAATSTDGIATTSNTLFTSTLNEVRITNLCLDKPSPITDNCTDPFALSLSSNDDTTGTSGCNGLLSVKRTYIITDSCGNADTCAYTFTISDTTQHISNITTSICSGNSLTVGDSTFTQTGIYTVVIDNTTICDCDSTITVNLTVVPQVSAGIDGSTTACGASNTAINLFDLITNEQSGGAWSRISGSGGSLNTGSGVFTINSSTTNSTFQYVVTGTAPCPNDTSIATVYISCLLTDTIYDTLYVTDSLKICIPIDTGFTLNTTGVVVAPIECLTSGLTPAQIDNIATNNGATTPFATWKGAYDYAIANGITEINFIAGTYYPGGANGTSASWGDAFGGFDLTNGLKVYGNGAVIDNTSNANFIAFATIASNNALLDGFSFIGFSATGAGAVAVNPNLTGWKISNCNFDHCDLSGDAVEVSLGATGNGVIENCKFYNNTTASGGVSALEVSGAGTLAINGTAFSCNLRNGPGGAAQIGGGANVTFDNCDFIGNVASSASGGALYVLGGANVNISNTNFISNTANVQTEDDGGAIYVIGGSSLTITNSVFKNNIAKDKGGAISAVGGAASFINLNISGTVFDSNRVNTATTYGGAIYMNNVFTNIVNNYFLNNKSQGTNSNGGGGAICVEVGDATSDIYINGNSFSGNIASNNVGNDIFAYSDVLLSDAVSTINSGAIPKIGVDICGSNDMEYLAAPLGVVSNCFIDKFNRTTVGNTVGNGWTETETQADGIYISGEQVLFDGASGYEWLNRPLSPSFVPNGETFNPILTNNNSVLTWSFNLRLGSSVSGFDAGDRGLGVVLSSTSNDYTLGDGYAVVLGQASGSDAVRLVRFNGGVDADANLTNIISDGTVHDGSTNNSISVKVEYNPTTDNWTLYTGNASSPSWFREDPRQLSSTTNSFSGSAVDATYTNSSMSTSGVIYNDATSTLQNMTFDSYAFRMGDERSGTGWTGSYGNVSAAYTCPSTDRIDASCIELEHSFCNSSLSDTGSLGNYSIDTAGCVTYYAGNLCGNEDKICVLTCDATSGRCDTTIIFITVLPVIDTIFDTICEGQTLTVCDSTYTSSGTFVTNCNSVSGCDSVIIVNLIVNPIFADTVFLTTCNLNNVDTVVQNLTTTLGCDSIITTITTLLNKSFTTVNATSCNPADTGTVVNTITGGAANGCDSIVTTITTLIDASFTTVNATSCNPADTGTVVNTITGGAANGCDSIVTTITTLINPSFTTVNATSCNPADTGTVVNTITGGAANGCDSIITTITTLIDASFTTVNATSCNPADTGTVINTITGGAANGCDSIVTTITTLIDASFTTVNATSCNPADTGTVVNTITGGAANGCDSIVTTITTLIDASFTTVNATSCNPADTGTVVNTITGGAANGCDSIVTTITTLIDASFTTVNATSCNPADTGTVVNTITGGAANGCDSIITTITTLIDASFTTVNATSCNPADTGTVVNTITGGAANGCDSIVTTITTLIDASFTTVNATSCNPADTGTVVNTITGGAANGCDSIVTTITTLIDASFTTVNATSCNPADTGTVVNTITGGAANGCDSIITTITTLINASFTTVNATSCNPADTGTVVNTITGGAANGCDSIITTITTLIDASFTTVNATSCNPADTGTVVNTITGGAANGCDSIVTTITTLIDASFTTVNATSCNPADTGTVVNTITGGAANGCDSIITTITTLIDASFTTVNATSCNPADTGTVVNTITGGAANGCDSIITTITTLIDASFTTVNATSCNPADTGTVVNTITGGAANGCDSIVTTITTLIDASFTTVNATSCNPADTGTVINTITGGAANGCDSIVTTITTLIDASFTTVNATSCNPADTGTVVNTITGGAANGCDSIITTITTLITCVTPDTIYDTVPVNDTVVVCVNLEPIFDPAQTTYTFCDGSTTGIGTLGTYEIDDNGCVTYVAGNTPGDENEICVIACDANLGICDTTIIIITVVPPTVTPDTIYDTVPVNDTVVVCVDVEPTFDPAQTTYTFCDGSTTGTGTLGTYEIDDNGCVTYVAGNTPGDENEICVIACDANLGICDTTIIIITVVPPTVTPDTIYDTVPVNDTVVVCVNIEPTFDPAQTTYTFCDGSTTGTGTLGTYEIDDNGCVTYVAANTPGDENEICVIACDANLGICDTTIIIITVVPPTVTPDTIYDTVPVNDTVVVCVNLEPTFDPAQTTYTFCDGSTTGTGTLGTYEIDDNGCVTYVAGNTPGDENEICVIACDANLGICDTTIIIITVVPPTVTPDTIYDTVPVNDTVVVCVNIEPTFDPAQTTYTFCDGSTTGTGTLGTYEIDDNGCVTYVAGNTPGDENEICVIACDANLGICDTTIIIITVVPPTVTPDTIYDTVPVNDTVVVCVNIEPTFDPAQTTYTFCDGSTTGTGTLGTYEIDDNGCVTYVAANTPGDENEICVIACDANLGICDTTIIIITVVPPTVTPDTIYDTVPVNNTVVVCVNIEPTFDPAQTTYTFCDGSTTGTGTLGTYEIDDNGCVTYVAANTPGDENEICVIACDANLGICDTTIIIITVVPPTVTPDTIYDTVPVNDTVVVCVNIEPTFDPAQTTYTFCDGSTADNGTLGTYEIDDNGCVTYVAGNTPGDENEICVIACDANLGICDTTIIIITVVPPTVTPDTIYDTVPVNDTVVVCVNLEPTFDPAQTTYTFCDGSTTGTGTLGTYEIDDNGCVTYVAENTPGDENEICVIACDANLGICDTTIIIITVVPPTVTPDTIYDTVPVNDTVVVCVNLEPTFDPAQTTYTFCDGSTTGTGTLGTYEIDDNGCVTYVAANTPGDENEICVIACDANLGICDTTIIIITVVPPTATPDTIYDTVPVNDTVVVCVNVEPTFDPAQTTYTFCDGSTTGTGTLGTYEIDDNGCVTYVAANTPGDENEICVIACDANLGICDTTIIIITVVPPTATPDTIYDTVPVNDTVVVCVNVEPTFDPAQTTYTFCDGSTTGTGILGTYEIDDNGCVTYVAGNTPGDENEICVIACDANLGICDTTIIIITVVPPTVTPDTIYDTVPVNDTVVVCVNIEPTFDPAQTTYTFCDGSTADNGTLGTYEIDDNGCVTYVAGNTPGDENEICVIACDANLGICDTTIIIITVVPPTVTPDTIYDTVPVNDTVVVCVNLEPTFDPAQTTYTFCDGSTTGTGTLGTYEIDDNGCVTYVAANTPGDENEICVIACDANLGICDTTIIIITVVPPTVTPDTIYDTVPVNDTVVVCVNVEPTFDPAQTTYTFCDGSTTGTGILGTYEIDDNGCVTYVAGNTPGDENEICVIACDANLGICDTTIIIITVVPPTVTPDTIYDTVPVNDTVVVCVNLEPTFNPAQTTYTFCDGSTTGTGTLGTYEIDDNGCVTYVAANTPGDENEICVIACDANLGICDTTIIIITVLPVCPNIPDVNISLCDTNGIATYCLPIPLTDLLTKYSIYIDGDEFFDLPDICDLDTTGGYDFTTAINSGTYVNSDIHRIESWSVGGTTISIDRFYGLFDELVFVMDSIDPAGNWSLDGDRIIGGEIGQTYGNLQIFSPTRGTRSIIAYNINVSSLGSLFEFEEGCHELVLVNNETDCIDTVIVCVTCPCLIPIEITQDVTICEGSTYEVGDSVYTETGTYMNIFTSILGCDSVITTNLVVNNIDRVNQTLDICQGDQIMVGGSVYNATGNYTDTLENVDGCDSIINTALIVHDNYYIEENVVLCNGGSYNYHGEILTTSGTFRDTLSTLYGCDSIIVLNLTITNYIQETEIILPCTNGGATYCLPIPLTDILGAYDIYIDGDQFFDLPDICDLDSIGGYDFTTAVQQGTYSNTGIHRLEKWMVNGVDYNLDRFYGNYGELAMIMDSIHAVGNWVVNGDRIEGGNTGNTYGPLQIFSPTLGSRSYIEYNLNILSRGTALDLNEGCHSIVVEDRISGCKDSVEVCVICVTPDTIYTDVDINDTVQICVTLEDEFDADNTTYTFCDGTTSGSGNLGTYVIDDNGCVTYVAGNTPGVETPICVIACDASIGICDTTIIIITVIPPIVSPDTLYDTTDINTPITVCVELEDSFDEDQTTYSFCNGSTVGIGNLGTYTIDDKGCVNYVAANTPGVETPICVVACDGNLGICDTTIIIITVIPPVITPAVIYDTVLVNQSVTVCVEVEDVFDEDITTFTFCDGSTSGTGVLGTYAIDDKGCVTYTAGNTPGDELPICVIACDANLGLCDTTTIYITVVPPSVTIDTIEEEIPEDSTEVICVELEDIFDGDVTTYTFCDGTTAASGTLGTYSIDENGCVTYTAGDSSGVEEPICVIACDANLGICDTTIIIIVVTPPTIRPDTIPLTVYVGTTGIICDDAFENGVDGTIVSSTLCDGTTSDVTIFGNYQTNGDGCLTYHANDIVGYDVEQICVVTTDGDGNVDTTIFIISILPLPDTIEHTIYVGGSVEDCIDIPGGMLDPVVSLCDGGMSGQGEYGTYTLNEQGCLTYQAGNTPGTDEICVVVCDALQPGLCDTTIFIIHVVPTGITPDTVYHTQPINTDSTYCLETELGEDVAWTFCDGTASGEGQFGTYVLTADGCLIYSSGNQSGVEEPICVVACKDGLCDTVIVFITVTECFIPNTFSPDGNGYNDYFEIKCIEPDAGALLCVFNRWGTEVYRNESYDNRWDGRYKGEDLPDGTYYYVLKYADGNGNSIINQAGFVVIQRVK